MPAPIAASAAPVSDEGATNLKDKVDGTEAPSEASDKESAPAVEEPAANGEVTKESAIDAGDKASGSDSADVDQPKTSSEDAPALTSGEVMAWDTPDAKPEEQLQEPPATRVARIWTEYIEKNEKLKDADRLALSSEYRQWSKTAELGLPEGVTIPPFTEVWLAANRKPAVESSKGKQKGSKKKRGGAEDGPPVTSVNAIQVKNGDNVSKSQSGSDPLADFAAEAKAIGDKSEGEGGDDDGKKRKSENRRSRHEKPAGEEPELSHARSIEMFDLALRSLCEGGLSRDLPINACVLSDYMRRRFGREYHISKTPFERFGDLVKAAADEGLIKVKPRGSQYLIEWIKYPYEVLNRDGRSTGPRERRRRSRSRRRPDRQAGRDAPSRDARPRGDRRDRERRDRAERDRGRSARRNSGRGAYGRQARPRQASRSPEYSYDYESYTEEDYSYSASPQRRPKQSRYR